MSSSTPSSEPERRAVPALLAAAAAGAAGRAIFDAVRGTRTRGPRGLTLVRALLPAAQYALVTVEGGAGPAQPTLALSTRSDEATAVAQLLALTAVADQLAYAALTLTAHPGDLDPDERAVRSFLEARSTARLSLPALLTGLRRLSPPLEIVDAGHSSPLHVRLARKRDHPTRGRSRALLAGWITVMLFAAGTPATTPDFSGDFPHDVAASLQTVVNGVGESERAIGREADSLLQRATSLSIGDWIQVTLADPEHPDGAR